MNGRENLAHLGVAFVIFITLQIMGGQLFNRRIGIDHARVALLFLRRCQCQISEHRPKFADLLAALPAHRLQFFLQQSGLLGADQIKEFGAPATQIFRDGRHARVGWHVARFHLLDQRIDFCPGLIHHRVGLPANGIVQFQIGYRPLEQIELHGKGLANRQIGRRQCRGNGRAIIRRLGRGGVGVCEGFQGNYAAERQNNENG